jgi:3-keto-disaccharide hydrolase
MSSSDSFPSDPSKLVPFIAEAGDATTQIFVIDGRFDLVTKGLGRLETRIPPGLYKVKFKAGASIQEVYQAVRPGSQPVSVNLSQGVKFGSPVPLENTALSHEYHRDHSHRISSRMFTDVTLGKGSELFLFVRDYFGESVATPLDSQRSEHPATGLALHDLTGKLLVNFTQIGERRQNQAHEKDDWAGATLALDPGTYQLRVDVGEFGILEQSIVTCPGWQTQVFLLRREYGQDQVVRRADLSGASILMSRSGAGFDPYLRSLRLTEMARQGLENGQAVVSDAVLHAMLQDQPPYPPISDAAIEEMLSGKYENPMLGIYGAHLLLQNEEKHDLLRAVVANLHRLVGDEHPDVLALDLWLDEQQNVHLFAAPPMLLSSWNIVVGASIRRPDIVPSESLSSQIGINLRSAGPWLVWRTGIEQEAKKEDELAFHSINRGKFLSPASLAEEVAPLIQSGSILRAADYMARKMGLDTIETYLLGSLVESLFAGASTLVGPDPSATHFLEVVRDAVEKFILCIGPGGTELRYRGKEGDPQLSLCAYDLARSLRVPRATVDSALARLYLKFDSFFPRSPQNLPPEPGFIYLFDNTAETVKDWRFVGEGAFELRDGVLQAQPGADFGILYYTSQTFGDFILRLQFRLNGAEDDSGVFVRFRDPLQPVPDRNDPSTLHPYEKNQWVPVHTGFEIQIDELARGNPGGLDEHRTGAVYGVPIGHERGQQSYTRSTILLPQLWYDYEITVIGQTYEVRLNGVSTASFINSDGFRGKPPTGDPKSGYIGLQSLSGQVAFRTIRVKLL